MKKAITVSLMLVLFLGIFTAPSLAEKKVLDFIWFTDGIEDEVLKEIMEDYKELHPDIDFNLIEIPANEERQKITTMIAGGNPPDLARLTLPGAMEPALLDLTPYVGEDYLDNFIEASHPYVDVNDRLIALPVDVTANGIIYNKDYFEAAGVELPDEASDEIWTWEEWADALEKVVKNSNARFGVGMDFTPHRWSTLLYQAGGKFFNEDLSTMAINTDEAVEAVKFFVELHDRGLMPASVWLGGENPQTLFRAGITAAHFAGNWMLTNYRDTLDFNWGVAYLPKDKIRSSVPGGKYIGTFKNAKYKEEAAEFIKYFTSREVNAKFNRDSLFLSARVDNSELDYEFGAEMFEIFSNDLAVTPAAAGVDWANSDVINQMYDDIVYIIVEAIQHNITPEEAVEEIERLGNELIEENM